MRTMVFRIFAAGAVFATAQSCGQPPAPASPASPLGIEDSAPDASPASPLGIEDSAPDASARDSSALQNGKKAEFVSWAILPTMQPNLAVQTPGGGSCRTDADCAVGSSSCPPCGGCRAVMSRAEADRLAHTKCVAWNGPSPSCSPCPRGPNRAVCINTQCVGVMDPSPITSFECTTAADCILVAYAGCCTCPSRWEVARAKWAQDTEQWCKTQPCSIAAASCTLPRALSGTMACERGSCAFREP